MTKNQITQIQGAFARLSDSIAQDLPRLGEKLTGYLDVAAHARAPLPKQTVDTICAAAGDVERACNRFRDIETLRREFGPVLGRIAERFDRAEEHRREWLLWSHAVAAHRPNAADAWEFAGSTAECLSYIECQRSDGATAEYSVKSMSVLQSGQRLAAVAARRSHDDMLTDIPF